MKDHSLSQAFEPAWFSRPEVQRFLNSSKANGQIVPEAEVQIFPGSVAPYPLAQHQVPRQVRPAHVIFLQNIFMQ